MFSKYSDEFQVLANIGEDAIFLCPECEYAENIEVHEEGVSKCPKCGNKMIEERSIVQTDEIKEGDTIVSSGNDLFPAGLIVGMVRHVQANETQLFKGVSVTPAIDEITLGKVLVIKN